jgi:hypothetical protein
MTGWSLQLGGWHRVADSPMMGIPFSALSVCAFLNRRQALVPCAGECSFKMRSNPELPSGPWRVFSFRLRMASWLVLHEVTCRLKIGFGAQGCGETG